MLSVYYNDRGIFLIPVAQWWQESPVPLKPTVLPNSYNSLFPGWLYLEIKPLRRSLRLNVFHKCPNPVTDVITRGRDPCRYNNKGLVRTKRESLYLWAKERLLGETNSASIMISRLPTFRIWENKRHDLGHLVDVVCLFVSLFNGSPKLTSIPK